MDGRPPCRTLLLLLLLLVSVALGGPEDDGWSMKVQAEVRGMEGYPVVLPCSFSHPQRSQHASLQVLWRLGHGPGAAVLYRCTTQAGAPGCQAAPQQDPRFRLEGDPREHDLSLRINSAALQDSGRYYCRVEVQGREPVSFEDKMGTRLRVEAPPKILALSVEGTEQRGYRALCRVQGSPLPDVQWLGPEEPLQASPAGPPSQGSGSRYHTVSQLKDVEADRQYTCSASNPLGRDQAALYVLPPPAPPPFAQTSPPLLLLLVVLSVGAKLLLLLGVGVWAVQGGALQALTRCWK